MKINLEIKIFVRYLNLEVSYIEIRFEIVELTSRNVQAVLWVVLLKRIPNQTDCHCLRDLCDQEKRQEI